MHAASSQVLIRRKVPRELLSALATEYGVISNNLVAVMHDRASVKSVEVRTLKVLYPDFLDVGCFSHTIDHIRDNFATSILYDFETKWVSLFANSPKTRLLWRARTGHAIQLYSQIRWWSHWEVYKQLMTLFADVLPFLEENPELAPSTRRKLLAILHDTQKSSKLQLQLAVVIDAGKLL